MPNSTHCIVILYNGNDIPDFAQNAIMEQLVQTLVDRGICIPELTTVVYKDSEGVAASIARDVLAAKQQVVEPIVENPVTNALVYLKNRYEKELSNSNLIPLVLKLTDDIRAHRASVAKGEEGDILLMNSLEIISTKGITVAELTVHGITERAINAMQQVYRYI